MSAFIYLYSSLRVSLWFAGDDVQWSAGKRFDRVFAFEIPQVRRSRFLLVIRRRFQYNIYTDLFLRNLSIFPVPLRRHNVNRETPERSIADDFKVDRVGVYNFIKYPFFTPGPELHDNRRFRSRRLVSRLWSTGYAIFNFHINKITCYLFNSYLDFGN